MTIDERLIKEWKSLYDRGDAAILAEAAGVHKNSVFNALKTGRTSSKLFIAMQDLYFERRQRMQNKYHPVAESKSEN